MKIIVDCGGTKGDWRFINRDGTVITAESRGFSPVLQNLTDLEQIIKTELPAITESIEEVHYYGTGVHGEHILLSMETLLKELLHAQEVNINSDLFAACRATCQDQGGIVAILGTGSSSCLYNGQIIIDKVPSLGYAAGDEGSGSSIGRRVLQSYFYREMPANILEVFEENYALTRADFLENLYKRPGANTYLASFADFAITFKSEAFIHDLILEEFDRFVQKHLIKYDNDNGSLSCHFVGSVAWFLQDELKTSIQNQGLSFGRVIRKPIDQLVAYHKYNK